MQRDARVYCQLSDLNTDGFIFQFLNDDHIMIGSIFFPDSPYLTCSPHNSPLVVLARVNRIAVAL
ncbi:hypothetical protein EYF80_029996 [Liparis tanakae]|uniref:Uncharacterized protein n=1 Tax=Liparis tanakae TaxID=230148 RepID=A0A4Z2H2K2_9TELE|nr:hypothetical protein EYF80_029996 [Liparis tanakae]